jgi:hypothetical protein
VIGEGVPGTDDIPSLDDTGQLIACPIHSEEGGLDPFATSIAIWKLALLSRALPGKQSHLAFETSLWKNHPTLLKNNENAKFKILERILIVSQYICRIAGCVVVIGCVRKCTASDLQYFQRNNRWKLRANLFLEWVTSGTTAPPHTPNTSN